MYISPVVRARLSGDFKEAHSHQVPITQTSAEDFVTFMRAVAPGREPGTGTPLNGRRTLQAVQCRDLCMQGPSRSLPAFVRRKPSIDGT